MINAEFINEWRPEHPWSTLFMKRGGRGVYTPFVWSCADNRRKAYGTRVDESGG